MLSEYKVVILFDYVFLILWIILIESVKKLGLYKPLLKEALLVFKDLQGNELFGLMVKRSQHNAKGSLT